MPYIKVTDYTGQVHSVESNDPELCADWLWEMVCKYATMNPKFPAMKVEMVALTVAGDDTHDRPDWIRGFPTEGIGVLGHSAEDATRNFIARLQEHL